MAQLLKIEVGKLKIEFSEESGGLPEVITVTEGDGQETELWRNGGTLELETEDGVVARPVASKNKVDWYRENDCTRVNFSNLHWIGSDGKVHEEYYLTLNHEFYDDGTSFTNMFFSHATRTRPGSQDLS